MKNKFYTCDFTPFEEQHVQDRIALAVRRAIEECARLVEQKQERITETSDGSERSLSPRMAGNQMGLAYAEGIRALMVTSQDGATP